MPQLTVTQVKNDSSIEIARNSKGWTFSVKAYGADPAEIEGKLKTLKDMAVRLTNEGAD